MHCLKPNTDYRIIQIHLAVPADVPDGEVAHAVSELLNSAIVASEEGNGCVDDWAYRGQELPLKRTSSDPEEGELFA